MTTPRARRAPGPEASGGRTGRRWVGPTTRCAVGGAPRTPPAAVLVGVPGDGRGTAALAQRAARTAAECLLPAGPPATHRCAAGRRSGAQLTAQLPTRDAGARPALAPGPAARVDPALAPGFD